MYAFVSSSAFTLRHRPFSSSSVTSPKRCISPRSYPCAPARPSPSMTLDLNLATSTTTLLCENPGWISAIAKAMNTLNVPQPIMTYGHPAMMGFMILGMGLPGAVFGWQGRLNDDKKKGVQQKQLHENVMIAFFLLAAFGGFGGTLSTAMQGYDIWQSPHAISALVVLLLLGANSVIAYSNFSIGTDGTPKGRLQGRKLHAYFGIGIMAAFVLHIVFGVQILLG